MAQGKYEWVYTVVAVSLKTHLERKLSSDYCQRENAQWWIESIGPGTLNPDEFFRIKKELKLCSFY